MLNMFLDIVADPPQCLVWLPLMHRMANVEHGKQTNKHTHTHTATCKCLESASIHWKNLGLYAFLQSTSSLPGPLVSKIFKFYLIYLLLLL